MLSAFCRRAVSPMSRSCQPADSAPAVVSPVSINAEMVRVVDHAAHELWNAEKSDATLTDAQWENIVEHATQISAAGALIQLERTGPNDLTFVRERDWHKFATAVSIAGLAALKAGETRNKEALVIANGQLVETCEGCHKQFKPSLPSEGITHSHAH